MSPSTISAPFDGDLALSNSKNYNPDQVWRPANSPSAPMSSADCTVDTDTVATVPSEKIVPVLQNIVAGTNLGVELDLKHISQKARNAEYKPCLFSAVVLRIRHPKKTALVFRTGKLVVTGAKSEKDSATASRKFAKIIYKLGYENARYTGYAVHNVVASHKVGFHIRLERLALEHMLFSSYEPELFPALIYRMKEPKVALPIFFNGNVVLTGGKSRKQIFDAFEKICPVLELFRKPEPPAIG